MKRIITVFLFMLILSATSSAQTITAMATEPYMDEFALYACEARLHDYDSETNMLEIELIIPEVFRKDEVESLQIGDSIYTNNQEVLITSISEEYGYIVLNMGDYEFSDGSVWLSEDINGNYRPVIYDDYLWMEMARIELPITENLLFLDGIDPATGTLLDMPSVHTSEEFLRRKAGEDEGTMDGPGFNINNVMVVFDADGQLAVIRRHYVPWQ